MGRGRFSRLASAFTAAALSAALAFSGCADKPKPAAPAFNAAAAPVPVGPARLSNAQLLDTVERQTLRYFIENAHPVSGMARERTNGVSVYGADIVTTGGTGFGVMAMVAGVERSWLGRDDAVARIAKITDFLTQHGNAADYHGMFPHFMDGTTGKNFVWFETSPSGDLVETSFLMMGLLTARQYFSGNTPQERALRDSINTLWQAADWNFYTHGQDHLHWHWSPTKGPGGLILSGWNEGLIAYVLAAASPTHPISRSVYEKGWSRDGAMKNGQSYENTELPLGPDSGGPLFFTHYSFLGLDPRGLKDQYADYWRQNRNHALINHDYCVRNPQHFRGYGPAWGLTASDASYGYDAFSPTNDHGVVAPTGAISSMPYTPDYSLQAMRHYYEDYGGKLWGPYGFVDAFDENRAWQADTDLSIDEGPIVAMIENYRSALLWNLFMGAPEIRAGLTKLGFDTPYFRGLPPPPPSAAPAP